MAATVPDDPRQQGDQTQVRRTVLFSGRVQGVGFRFVTCRVAADFAVTGTVRNLPDGRVELIAEGAPDVVDDFIEAVRRAKVRNLTDLSVTESPASGTLSGFRIVY
ncbi:MAG: acylphosphatase [Planctomycetes bacterium]|nr:acylphosphatase [Planctomycetota bacterium]